MRKVKLGFLGTGLCARTIHLPALQALPDQFEIVNVSSRNEAKCSEFAQLAGAKRWCTNYYDLLKDDQVEAVCVVPPFDLNYQMVKNVLAAGKHVIVEKPMADSMVRAKEMVEWERETNLVTMVAENFRYRKSMMRAAEYIQSGSIGKPHTLQYTCYGHMNRQENWVVDSKWRLSSLGGVLLDRDVHYTATMRMMMGDVKSAIGRWGKMRDDIGPMDYAALHMLFENGVTGSLLDIASVKGIARREVIVVGSEGTVMLSEQCTKLTVINESGLNLEETYKTDRADSFVREYEDFYQAICSGAPTRSSFYEGYKDLQLALTAIGTNDRWDALNLV